MEKQAAMRLLELEKELQRRDAIRRFSVFLDYSSPTYDRQWFHTLIADKCQQLLEGKLGTDRLMIFVPPQHGKSEIVSRKFPAWALGVNPLLKIVGSSYSADLAEQFSRSIQRTIDSSEYGEVFPNTFLNNQHVTHDKNRGWVLSADEAVYGKNGFLLLGDETGKGGSICSPFYEGIRKDSLAVVSFRAVAFTDKEGVKDGNKFTVEIIDGGVFRDNGSTSMDLEAPYADITASNYPANFWDGSDFLLGIISSDKNPFTGNTRIRISSGSASSPNRVFIDNFYIRRIDAKEGDEDLWEANGGSGKDMLLGAPKQKLND